MPYHFDADDTMIYLAVKNEQDARILQEDLNKLTTWELGRKDGIWTYHSSALSFPGAKSSQRDRSHGTFVPWIICSRGAKSLRTFAPWKVH